MGFTIFDPAPWGQIYATESATASIAIWESHGVSDPPMMAVQVNHPGILSV